MLTRNPSSKVTTKFETVWSKHANDRLQNTKCLIEWDRLGADHVSNLGSPRRLWRWASFVLRQYSHRRTTENLQGCQILSQLSASHGSRFPLAFVVRTGNQGLAKRLGASPNRPVWSGAAVQALKEGRSHEATTRCIKGLEDLRSAIFGPSHHHHTLVLDLAFSTNAPVGQTVPRLAVWTVGAMGGEPPPMVHLMLLERAKRFAPTPLYGDFFRNRGVM